MSIKHLNDIDNHDSKNFEIFQTKYWMTPNPYCIQGHQTLRECAEIMERLQIESLPVIDAHNQLFGMITLKKLISYLLNGNPDGILIRNIVKRNFSCMRTTDSLLNIKKMPHSGLPVIDDHNHVVGFLGIRDILDANSLLISRLQQKGNIAEVLQAILESAYEGIAVVDEDGILVEFNEAYSRFTGIEREGAIGRHVTEVIDNTNLHLTVKSGIPERGVVQNIQGQDMVVHRIPIWKEGRVTGAIGMLIFEGVSEVYKLYESLQKDHVVERNSRGDVHFGQEENQQITLDQILGISEEISKVKRLSRRAAKTLATLLITGESGTGKEMFAKGIHHLSILSNGPFVSVNCGAIPEALFESELFGYEEGAFTGAKKGGKPGKFELAHNGTIFLDEIGEMPLLMQSKLLRVLQEKEAERVGGLKKYKINVRIIAATNRDLKAMVEQGLFREDLYYRLNVIQLHIPPLRNRKDDIPILLSNYLKKLCKKYQIPTKTFTAEAVTAFVDYDWKGNIREMINTLEQLVTFVDGQIISKGHLSENITDPKLLPKPNPANNSSNQSVLQAAKDVGKNKERELIINVLREAGGNKKKASEILGIHRTTLYQKLKRHNIF
ncbi:sigma-54-dependent Fis family transcriptional regulator [Peribacillus glennii]|uniref:CBS domain-containing protein n=1 Tax=Peribacillus glennii TaxID=2303991 RepID=A0A372LLE1_9BACI|nr:sigma-54-dependent Fis family transcriptional regulator [Peribacillus glennii]RFU66593.1 CBS domain-containing protein [Peribacillus glennii]